MIHSVRIPGRLGIVQMGDGGSASTYTFDADTGLSKDARLAYYLQDLTPAQLQNALDSKDPSADLSALLEQERTGTGAGWLPCGQPGNPCGPEPGIGIPTWVWIAGGGALLAVALSRR